MTGARHKPGVQEGLETLSPIVDDLPDSTYELLRRSAEAFEDKIALRFLTHGSSQEVGETHTYRELVARITQTANALSALGVGHGDAVSMLLPNLPQAHFTIWGAEAVGVANPLNPMLDTEHLVAIMNEAGSKVLVTLAPSSAGGLWEKAQAIIDRVPSLSAVLTVRLAAPDRETDSDVSVGNCQILDFDSLVSKFDAAHLHSEGRLDRSSVASLFHTGGTTGTPKLAPHSHHNEVVMAWQLAEAMGIGPQTTALCGLPLFHVNAVFVTGLAPWMVGAQVLLASPQGFRNPTVRDEFWALVETHKVSYFSAVPTILSDLLDRPNQDYDLSSLAFCACGAAPLSVELMSRFEARTGVVVLEGYGQTEGCCASTTNRSRHDRKVGSVGRPLSHLELRTVALDEAGGYLRDCEVDEVGSIVIKGPNVFAGYTKQEHNQGLWLDGGWFLTGDLGRLDEDGFLWLTGRSKDLIIRGGHNIDPQVIEEALYKHPAVTGAAAVGKPDARVGELPVAYVQLSAAASSEDLLKFAAEHIRERAAIPKEIWILDALPVTAVGKIFKPALRRDIVKRVVEAELLAVDGVTEADFVVTVEASKRLGQLAIIQLAVPELLSQTVRSRLDAFAFAYELQTQTHIN